MLDHPHIIKLHQVCLRVLNPPFFPFLLAGSISRFETAPRKNFLWRGCRSLPSPVLLLLFSFSTYNSSNLRSFWKREGCLMVVWLVVSNGHSCRFAGKTAQLQVTYKGRKIFATCKTDKNLIRPFSHSFVTLRLCSFERSLWGRFYLGLMFHLVQDVRTQTHISKEATCPVIFLVCLFVCLFVCFRSNHGKKWTRILKLKFQKSQGGILC